MSCTRTRRPAPVPGSRSRHVGLGPPEAALGGDGVSGLDATAESSVLGSAGRGCRRVPPVGSGCRPPRAHTEGRGLGCESRRTAFATPHQGAAPPMTLAAGVDLDPTGPPPALSGLSPGTRTHTVLLPRVPLADPRRVQPAPRGPRPHTEGKPASSRRLGRASYLCLSLSILPGLTGSDPIYKTYFESKY